LFEKLDLNSNGNVTWEEFESYITLTHKARGQARGDKWLKTLLHTICWSEKGTESMPSAPDTSFGRRIEPAGDSSAEARTLHVAGSGGASGKANRGLGHHRGLGLATKHKPNHKLITKPTPTMGPSPCLPPPAMSAAMSDPHSHHNLRDSETALRESQIVGLDEAMEITQGGLDAAPPREADTSSTLPVDVVDVVESATTAGMSSRPKLEGQIPKRLPVGEAATPAIPMV